MGLQVRWVGSRASAPRRGARRWLAPGLMSLMLIVALAAPVGSLAVANTPPVPGIDTITTDEDTPATGNVLTNDTDADGNPLQVATYTPLDPGIGTLVITLLTGAYTFTPATNWYGDTSTTYYVSDGISSTLGYILIHVLPVNDPPVAVDNTASGTEDTDLVIAGSTLVANDTDVEHDTLSVSAVSDATGGEGGLAAGSITFTPAHDLCGSSVAGFDYTVSDGNGGTDTGHVTISLACVNDAPVAVDDTGFAAQGSANNDYAVAANDTDVDDDTLAATAASVSPSAGSASIHNGMVRFTPLVTFKGDAVITYTVSDGALTDEGMLTVTVEPDTTAPIVAVPTVGFGSGRVDETAPITISWSATDAGVGVASYAVEASVEGGAFQPLYTGTATSKTAFYPFGKALVFRVMATDKEGNASGWVVSGTRTIVAYQAEKADGIRFTTTWSTQTSYGSSGTGFRYTTTATKYASRSFTGYAVLLVAPRTSASGYSKVYVDGAYVGRFSQWRRTTALGVIIARASWGTSGTHSIKIVNDQAGRRTNLDAIIVLQ